MVLNFPAKILSFCSTLTSHSATLNPILTILCHLNSWVHLSGHTYSSDSINKQKALLLWCHSACYRGLASTTTIYLQIPDSYWHPTKNNPVHPKNPLVSSIVIYFSLTQGRPFPTQPASPVVKGWRSHGNEGMSMFYLSNKTIKGSTSRGLDNKWQEKALFILHHTVHFHLPHSTC